MYRKDKEVTTMVYKIEGLVNGIWDLDAVGSDSDANSFPTQEDAQAQIPELARIFGCDESEFRVVEYDH